MQLKLGVLTHVCQDCVHAAQECSINRSPQECAKHRAGAITDGWRARSGAGMPCTAGAQSYHPEGTITQSALPAVLSAPDRCLEHGLNAAEPELAAQEGPRALPACGRGQHARWTLGRLGSVHPKLAAAARAAAPKLEDLRRAGEGPLCAVLEGPLDLFSVDFPSAKHFTSSLLLAEMGRPRPLNRSTSARGCGSGSGRLCSFVQLGSTDCRCCWRPQGKGMWGSDIQAMWEESTCLTLQQCLCTSCETALNPQPCVLHANP